MGRAIKNFEFASSQFLVTGLDSSYSHVHLSKLKDEVWIGLCGSTIFVVMEEGEMTGTYQDNNHSQSE